MYFRLSHELRTLPVDRPDAGCHNFPHETGNIVVKTITGCSSAASKPPVTLHAQGWNVIATMRARACCRAARLAARSSKPDSTRLRSRRRSYRCGRLWDRSVRRSKRHRWRPCGDFRDQPFGRMAMTQAVLRGLLGDQVSLSTTSRAVLPCRSLRVPEQTATGFTDRWRTNSRRSM